MIITLLATASLFTEYPLTATALIVLSERLVTRVTGPNLIAWIFCALAAGGALRPVGSASSNALV